MTYQRPQPRSIVRCVSIGLCGRLSSVIILNNQQTSRALFPRAAFMCVVVIILGCVCVLACPQCCSGQGWHRARLFGSYLAWNAVGTFAMVSAFTEKCIRQTLICWLPSAHGPWKSHICACGSHGVSSLQECSHVWVIILGDTFREGAFVLICASGVCVVCVCVYFCPILYYVTINWPQT